MKLLALTMLLTSCSGYTITPSVSLENDKGQKITAGVVIIKPDKRSNK